MLSLSLIAVLLTGNPEAPAKTAELCNQPAGATPATDKSECHHPQNAPATQASLDKAPLVRGEKIQGKQALKVSDAVRDATKLAGKTVLVEGTVRKACERKGCWMELADAKGAGMRVTFKDYGFFVPLDSAGAKARVEGLLQVSELSPERAKHYESEGAHVPRGTDGKPREVQLVASGVELHR
jgi:hypothetical protein